MSAMSIFSASALLLVLVSVSELASAGRENRFLGRSSFHHGQRCSPSWNGRLAYNGRTGSIVACDGRRWTHVSGTSWRGSSVYRTCYDILKAGNAHGDGFYFLTEPTSGEKYRAYCDMTTEGGGWTLFTSKGATNMNKLFTNTFNIRTADAISRDAAGCIPTFAKWREVLFRFKGDGGASRTVFTRYHGKSSGSKTAIINALTCGGPGIGNSAGFASGFYKHSPYENGGERMPVSNFQKVYINTYVSYGIGEHVSYSDRWLNLWNSKDGSNKYTQSDSAKARGTKCIAGVCYEKDTVWFMYR